MLVNKILVVDDNVVDLEIIAIACSSLDCPIVTASDPSEALELYKKEAFAIVLTDYRMQPMDGIEFISELRKIDPNANCLVMTGYPDARINHFMNDIGLSNIITKPIRPKNLTEQLRVALHRHEGATAKLNEVTISNLMDDCIALLGLSEEICQVRKKIAYLLDEKKPLFIEGPFGVGKQELVDFIHKTGARADGQMVKHDCKEMSEEAIESKLVSGEGEWGSSIKAAKGGTLVLSQVECMPLAIQQIFARKMKEVANSCLVITWADGMLDDFLDNEQIIPELYFELTLNTIHLPPLSERPVDIEAIVRYIAASPDSYELARTLAPTEIDILVAELRREPLKDNIRELIQRVQEACSANSVEASS
jgi:DNA-binding NtrC family response regulator